MKRLIIAASILFSVSANASALSSLNESMAQNAKFELMNHIEFITGDVVKATAAAAEAEKRLNKEVRTRVAANQSCAFMKKDFLSEQNALTDAEAKAGKFREARITVSEIKKVNSLMADYIGYKCMAVK